MIRGGSKIVTELVKKGHIYAILGAGGATATLVVTSIMTELLLGKTEAEALYIIEQYLAMIHEKKYDDSVLGEAIVFMNTHKQAARIKCATLGFIGAKSLLEEEHHHE
jgi:nitrogen fixation NifU-like protein